MSRAATFERAPHGTYARYIYRPDPCRCEPCVEAERSYQRWRKRMIAYGRPLRYPAIGTQRRVQALMRLGWPHGEIAARTGIAAGNLNTTSKAYSTVRTWKHEAVKKVYDELSMIPGPSERTRRYAIKHGFAPPLAWDDEAIDDPHAEPVFDIEAEQDAYDEIVVERFLDWALVQPTSNHAQRFGTRPPLEKADRVEAVRRLLLRGYTTAAIGVLIGRSTDYTMRLITEALGEREEAS